MKIKYKDIIQAMSDIEDMRRIPEEVVLDALKDAVCRAYRKEVTIDNSLPDINVVAEINHKSKTIDLYQVYNVVEEVEDDELEVSLEDALLEDKNAVLGGTIRRQVELPSFSRASATLAKNLMRQKIKEAEKSVVYDEYKTQLHEMVLGVVHSVKEKFALVELGKTVAMLPKSEQIPHEVLKEGERIRVVITNVSKETKGSQVIVSRASEMLVKRLFENEVPEIYQGVVEIKAIARNAGERTKMAVISHNEEVDPIGACIGHRGARVQDIIDGLYGEKIDIFLWSDDITQLVKNALAPAEVIAVLPGEEENSLLAIVAEDQLSLAIGRKGKNAQLAVKLCNRKIDIKTKEELIESGVDYDELVAKAEIEHQKMLEQQEKEKAERLEREAKEAEEKRLQVAAALAKEKAEKLRVEDSDELIPEEMQENVTEKIRSEMALSTESTQEGEAIDQETSEELEMVEEPAVEETVVEEVSEEPEVKVEETKTETKAKRQKVDLEAVAKKNDYVSAFEKFADSSKPKEQEKPKRKKRKTDDEDIKVRNKVLEQQLRKDFDNSNLKPIYTEEELEEIENQQMEEEENQYDIDYDEYEEYYDDEDYN